MDPAHGYSQLIIYCVQPKAWDNFATHTQWIEQVWWPFCGKQGQYTSLIHDVFKVHLQGKIVCHNQGHGTPERPPGPRQRREQTI